MALKRKSNEILIDAALELPLCRYPLYGAWLDGEPLMLSTGDNDILVESINQGFVSVFVLYTVIIACNAKE